MSEAFDKQEQETKEYIERHNKACADGIYSYKRMLTKEKYDTVMTIMEVLKHYFNKAWDECFLEYESGMTDSYGPHTGCAPLKAVGNFLPIKTEHGVCSIETHAITRNFKIGWTHDDCRKICSGIAAAMYIELDSFSNGWKEFFYLGREGDPFYPEVLMQDMDQDDPNEFLVKFRLEYGGI